MMHEAGSVVRSDLLERVCASLGEAGIPYVTLGNRQDMEAIYRMAR